MKNGMLMVVTGVCALSLAACGKEKSGDAANSETGGATAAASGWDASDACTLLDKANMGTILGTPVTETRLGLVNKAGTATAATSECTYTLSDNSTVTVMTRMSPIADNTPEAIEATRSGVESTLQSMGTSDTSVVDVAGLGKAAFFVPKVNQLNVFYDDSRSAMVTVPAGPDAKDKAVAIAKKLGG